MSTALICDNLSVDYGTKNILKNVSFTLKEEQNLLILGENGAGKSTLAYALCGLIKHTGNVSLFGLLGANYKERAKLINYVAPKLADFDENITLLDYLLMGLFIYKKKFEPYSKKDINKALELLEMFNLQNLASQNLASLSSGEKQIAMILQSALQSAKLTIFDEPIANVDSEKSQILFNFLSSNEIFKNKIIITHDLHFAFSLGFDILYISNKRAEFFGSCQEFFNEDALLKRFGKNVKKCDIGILANYAKI